MRITITTSETIFIEGIVKSLYPPMPFQLSWIEQVFCKDQVAGSSPVNGSGDSEYSTTHHSLSLLRMQFSGRTSAFQAECQGFKSPYPLVLFILWTPYKFFVSQITQKDHTTTSGCVDLMRTKIQSEKSVIDTTNSISNSVKNKGEIPMDNPLQLSWQSR